MITRCLRVGASALLLLTATACDRGAPAGGPPPIPPAPVLVAQATVEDVPVTLSAIGEVIPLTTVTIQPRVGGQIKDALVKDGQDVKAGQLLFQIDPADYQVALDQAQAALASTESDLRLAQLTAERAKTLYEKKIGTEQDYDTARLTAESKASAVQGARAAVAEAQLNLSYTEVRAPMAGRAGAVLVNPGNIVKINEANLLVINQIEPITVEFSVAEQQYNAIMAAFHGKEPVPVTAFINGDSDSPEAGKLFFVDNAINRQTGTLTMRARFDNAQHRLWPGQFVSVSLTVAHHPNTVVVPARAVQVNQEGNYVFTVDHQNVAHLQPVTVGAETAAGMTAVMKGLEAGATVVTDGMEMRLFPGARVDIKSSLQAAVDQAVQAGAPAAPTPAAPAPTPATAPQKSEAK